MQFQTPEASQDGPPARYHLLLAHTGGREHIGERRAFDELVAASGVVRPAGHWLATVDDALAVSSVEADARLARWSRQTGGLAIRITRPDPARFWIAVHHGGERLFVMVHAYGPTPGLGPSPASDLGVDPQLRAQPMGDSWRVVANTRAEQLSAALAQGHLAVAPDELAAIFAAPPTLVGPDRVRQVLDTIDAPGLDDLLGQAGPQSGVPPEVGQFIGRAMLVGCLVPVATGTAVFLVLSQMARSLGLGFFGFLGALLIAWSSMGSARQLAARFTGAGVMRQRMALVWAQPGGAPETGPVRADPEALDRWGGLFYLLRDIAFFAGIDRPNGPTSLYLEAWAVGPPSLIAAINETTGGGSPDALFETAQGLVELRRELIDAHLTGRAAEARTISDRVRRLLAPAVKAPTS